MFWIGFLEGSIVGGTIILILHCCLMIAKESDERIIK